MSGASLVSIRCFDKGGNNVLNLVLKQSPGGDTAVNAGLVREAMFYNLSDSLKLGVRIPRCYFAAADEATGAKALLLEDLGNAIQAGYFFDPTQPNNLGVDVAKKTAESDMNALRVTAAVFLSAAAFHGKYWNDEAIRELKCLRGARWTEEAWTAGQETAINMWRLEKVQAFFADDQNQGGAGVKWSKLYGLLEKSIGLSSWDEHQKMAKVRPFTLVHGDFHPGNMVVLPKDPQGKLSDVERCCFLDWEMVGVGSGPQELGQFLISHASAQFRREHERALVHTYLAKLNSVLCNRGLPQQTFEATWDEYTFGGLTKWLWFMPLLINWCPPQVSEYFAQKVTDFAEDHSITPDNVTMLRFF